MNVFKLVSSPRVFERRSAGMSLSIWSWRFYVKKNADIQMRHNSAATLWPEICTHLKCTSGKNIHFIRNGSMMFRRHSESVWKLLICQRKKKSSLSIFASNRPMLEMKSNNLWALNDKHRKHLHTFYATDDPIKDYNLLELMRKKRTPEEINNTINGINLMESINLRI